MSKSDAFETDILNLIFLNTKSGFWVTQPLTVTGFPANLYISLHTGTLLGSNNQSTNEVSYVGYARQAVARTAGGWTLSGTTQVANTAIITFPAAPASTNQSVTYFGIGTEATGTGFLIYGGTVSIDGGTTAGTRVITQDIAATFAAGTLIVVGG